MDSKTPSEPKSSKKDMHKSRGRKQKSQDTEVPEENNLDLPSLIDKIKHRIEVCLVSYMTEEEIVKKLNEENNIDPWLTKEVWRRLKRQNHEFFIAYDARLKLKEQILTFNDLLERQYQLMKSLPQPSIPPFATQNSGHIISGTPLNISQVAMPMPQLPNVAHGYFNPVHYGSSTNQEFSTLGNFHQVDFNQRNNANFQQVPTYGPTHPIPNMITNSGPIHNNPNMITNTANVAYGNPFPSFPPKVSGVNIGEPSNMASISHKPMSRPPQLKVGSSSTNLRGTNKSLEEIPRKFSISDLAELIDDLDYSIFM